MRANALEVKWRGGPSVSSSLLGLAHASSSGLARVSDCLQVGEDRMEEDDKDAPVLANALKVEQHGSLSVSSGSLGLACASDSLWVGEDQMEEEQEGEDTPVHANVLEVEWHSGPSVPFRHSGFAPGHDCFARLCRLWMARHQRVVVAEEEVSSPEPETNKCTGARRVEQPSRMSTHSRASELGGLAGSS